MSATPSDVRDGLQRSGGPELAALSQAVLQVHRGSLHWHAAAFDSRAIEALAAVLPFDACLWGSVRADAPAGAPPALHGLYVQGLDSTLLARCLAGDAPPTSLLAGHVEPLAARRVELRLWRWAAATEASPPFSAADLQSLQFLLPHLVEAQRESRLARARDGGAPARSRRSLALCDAHGVLQQIDEHGLALLRLEWPHWRGGRLPEPLAAVVAATARPAADGRTVADDSRTTLAPFYGRGITVQLSRSSPGLMLEVRRRAAADRLSARQRDIAQRYARGHTGPEIAVHLALSPSTVNNHLGAIFKKLAVKNKLQLLEAMRLPGE